MDSIDHSHPILKYHHRHLEKLVMLLGMKELYKITGTEDFKTMVNSIDAKPEKFRSVVEEIVSDDAFDALLEGDLYKDFLDLQMNSDEFSNEPVKGTLSWFLNLSDDED